MADPQDVPRGDEPGAATTPYDDGRGTIGLEDRIGVAAPDTNQGKTEPMPPTPGASDPEGTAPHTDPPGVPDLEEMGAGRALAQVASPPALPNAVGVPGGTLDDGGRHGGTPGTVPAADRDVVSRGSSASSTGRGSGPEVPASQTTGTAHRAPGLQGELPEGESVESDVAAGAARMTPGGGPDATAPPVHTPGDAQGVEVPHEVAAPGTSQEAGIAHGVKDPARQEQQPE